MLPRRALHLRQHVAPWRLRCFATNANSSNKNSKGLNLTQYVSPLLLRLHPDTIQRHSAALAQENEQAMKQLNQFLELAGFGCNNDTYNARKQVLSMAAARSDDASAPIRFPLLFHIPVEHEQQQQESVDTTASVAPGLTPMQYVIEVPGALVRRTLANSARASSRTQDPSAALQSPFAREWQRTTKRILQDLFQVAAIPLVAELEDGTTRSTQLALWLAEEDSVEYQHGVHVAAHNRQQHKEHERFDQIFHEMLTKEKNIVFATTTGMEDGPTCGAHEPDLGARVPPEARDARAEADRVQLARELSAHALHGAAAAQSRVEQDHAAREHRGGAREAAGGLGRRAPGGRHGYPAPRRDGLERARGFPVRARRSTRGGARTQGQSAGETRANQIQEPAANSRREPEPEPELTSEAEAKGAFLFQRSRCDVSEELSGRVQLVERGTASSLHLVMETLHLLGQRRSIAIACVPLARSCWNRRTDQHARLGEPQQSKRVSCRVHAVLVSAVVILVLVLVPFPGLLDEERRGVFLFAHKLVEVHDVEHDFLLRRHEQRVDEHHAQQARDDCAADDRAKHDRELPAECLRGDLTVPDARHRHNREPDRFVHVRELVIAAPTVLIGTECDVPFEKVEGRGREDPVDEERRHGRLERESLERVLGREPDRHDVHAVERADKVHVVRRRIEAEPIAEEAPEQVDAEQHEHVWVRVVKHFIRARVSSFIPEQVGTGRT